MLDLFSKGKIYQATNIVIKESHLQGIGVFANKNFKIEAVVETAPVILLQEKEHIFLQSTALFAYYFLIAGEATSVAVGLGYSSLYNHAANANAVYSISLKQQIIQIKACKKITTGDEIMINYNGSPNDESRVYFPETIS